MFKYKVITVTRRYETRIVEAESEEQAINASSGITPEHTRELFSDQYAIRIPENN